MFGPGDQTKHQIAAKTRKEDGGHDSPPHLARLGIKKAHGDWRPPHEVTDARDISSLSMAGFFF